MELVQEFYATEFSVDFAEIHPFASIVGPSLMGKTQFAFSLARLYPVIYVNFSEEYMNQEVYAAFDHISGMFKILLKLDCISLKDTKISIDSNKIKRHAFDLKLGVIGYIWALITYSIEFDGFKNSSVSDSNWFEYYLRPRTFNFEAMSIREYLQNLSKNLRVLV